MLERGFAARMAANPRLRLVLVGDGPVAEGLRRHHPEAVFRGMRTGTDLARHYASADLFLFPSLTETFGNVVLEAMASGLAVLAFDLLLYKALKGRTGRPRPCARHPHIDALVAPLDEFSFPSGHTLHAVGFTTTALYFHPGLAWLLLPFTGLVALSRPVLGLHYPSDVLAGALIGLGVALLVLQF